MKIKRLICSAASLALMLGLSVSASAQTPVGTGNPYLPLWEHLPDGEPRVFEDPDNPGKYRAYIIGSHDLEYKAYCGADIRMWSAPVEDLTDWRDEGPIFTYQVGGEWDTMFAPDLVEVNRPDGTREYYLYPHSRGANREPMVCKGSRPDGPFTPVNLTPDGKRTLPGSIIGFDPSVYVEQITDKNDPDYNIGFRAYAFWGYQISNAAQLDQNTMYSVRPGTEVKPYFLPSSARYGVIRDPEGTTYPALYKGQNPGDFNFYEASSIRKVGNKFLMIFSGYSGPDYGLGSSNSTLRYAYGDSPLGPWRSGGVLVDSRGVVLNQDGSALTTTNFGHNTHGSLEEINGHWYVFYHRPPRGYGFARQAMVAPVTIEWDEKPVSEGGKVVVRGYDPYAKDKKWEAAAANGDVYTGAEVTSEGFQVFGLDPFKYYSAGYACYFSNNNALQDSWDIWDNSMDVNMDKEKGADAHADIHISFDDAVFGCDKVLQVKAENGTSSSLKVHIPAGIDEGQSIRLKGKGEAGIHGGMAGDLLLKVHVDKKAGYERKGNDVYVTTNIPYPTAVLGGEAIVPTLTGKVSCKIPAGTQSGSKIHLKNKGICSMKDPAKKGDEYLVIQIDVPKHLTLAEQQKLREYDLLFSQHSV